MTDKERISLDDLVAVVRKGFSHINDRMATWEQRVRYLEGDGDVLRHGEERILAKIDSLDCARHEERLKRIERKVSEETRCLRNEHTTGQIEIAKLEAADEARKELLAENREVMRLAMLASEVRWKRIAIVLTPLTAIAAAIVTVVLKGCM